MHINGKESLGKFDPRSDEGIFLGYASSSKAYKVFNKRTRRIEECVHVVFDERTMAGNNLSQDFSIRMQKEDSDDEDEENSRNHSSRNNEQT